VGSVALGVEAGHTSLEPGESLLLFTDGLIEGRPAKRDTTGSVDLFGEERSRQEVRHHRKAPPERILQALVTAVTTYAGGPLADDLCLVAVRAASASAR
jgi:serine phosphatase RsbU (regulator of sigma subunit)